jgi:hypothetical protein
VFGRGIGCMPAVLQYLALPACPPALDVLQACLLVGPQSLGPAYGHRWRFHYARIRCRRRRSVAEVGEAGGIRPPVDHAGGSRFGEQQRQYQPERMPSTPNPAA